jgi:threonine dehydratase
VAVTSGANINFERLRLVSELADLGASTEVMMATTIPERPGAFREFVNAATGGSGSLSVTEFKYRCGRSTLPICSSPCMEQPAQPGNRGAWWGML